MLIFDQLKKDDPHLRLVALGVLSGLLVLLGGLWWVQIVSARDYRENLQTQSYRTVRIPAVRGRILDRDGSILAENRPTYNISLYLEELRGQFQAEYQRERPVKITTNALPFWQRWAGLSPVTVQRVRLNKAQIETLKQEARYHVASNVVTQISRQVGQPLALDPKDFEQHYQRRLVLPYPVLRNASPGQIARFMEQSGSLPGVDLELLSTRTYPGETLAGHVLGALQRDDSSPDGEEAFYSYRLPDFRGLVGVEFGCDKELRGMAGAKSVLVNSIGYRQTENVWNQAEPGHHVRLTIDAQIQRAAEQSLQIAKVTHSPPVRGAVVVMDVNTGDILAMASSPSINPNDPLRGYPPGEWQRRHDPLLRPEINRSTQENYQPGSIFKTVVAMAILEAGIDPNRTITAAENPREPGRAWIHVGNQPFRDTAAPGDYNFRKALKLSSNCYFISNGLRAGIENIVNIGHRLHLGERTGLQTRQDVAGSFPSVQRISAKWLDGDTANLCIGQGEIAATPLQFAVLTCAIANGGKVLWPRLVDRVEPADPTSDEPAIVFPSGQIRDQLRLKPSTLETLREAMLADVEDSDGTGREAAVPGMRVCGKTGTSQKKNARGILEEHITWFVSFAPYEQPKYAVVVMVESGASGGKTCAPVAAPIYAAILQRDQLKNLAGATVARTD